MKHDQKSVWGYRCDCMGHEGSSISAMFAVLQICNGLYDRVTAVTTDHKSSLRGIKTNINIGDINAVRVYIKSNIYI